MRDLFYRSFKKFLAVERANILNDVSERNLCHRLGFCLEEERRDLILHSRGENIRNDNLIAIEMKNPTVPKKEKTKIAFVCAR